MTTTAETAGTDPTIRPARPADLLDVHHIERRCFPQPWPFEAFHRHLDAPAFLVATVDATTIGYVVGDIGPGFPGPVGHIKDLAIHPDHRRQGIASQLLERALGRLADAGAVRVTLEVRASNEPAIALYRTAGFEPWRRRPGYYEDGEAAVVMARSLES